MHGAADSRRLRGHRCPMRKRVRVVGEVLGPSWAMLAHLGPSWSQLGASLGPFGPSWYHLGAIWAHLGTVLGPSWAILGLSWGVLGGSLGSLGGPWGSPEGPWPPCPPGTFKSWVSRLPESFPILWNDGVRAPGWGGKRGVYRHEYTMSILGSTMSIR